jgi:hypothetical protein
MSRISTSDEKRPLAGISLDLDNQWSYQRTHGDPGWEEWPTYLDTFVPPFLDMLDELDLKITFFVVGQDAALEKNARPLSMLVERGHEVGNHSFFHEPWLHLYSKEQLHAEVLKAEQAITRATGQKPVGFRGPGYSFSPELVELLMDLSYLYDATTLPTYLGPLAKFYYFRKSSLTPGERSRRQNLFGGFERGHLPLKPYIWRSPTGQFMPDIPVTTFPVMKVPFHMSYLLYISRYSEPLMEFYLRAALRSCRLTGVGLSFLLHPLDFMDRRQVPALAFFPAMNINREAKIESFKKAMGLIARSYRPGPLGPLAREILGDGRRRRIALRSS